MEDGVGVAGSTTSLSQDLAELNSDDVADANLTEGSEIETETETEPEVDEDVVDEEPEEVDVEGEEEEKPEEVDPNALPGRPTFKELKAKYPDIFKDFPGIREMMINESKYARVFPTIETAVQAARENQAAKFLDEKLMSGDSEVLLAGLKQNGLADKFVDNLLPTLEKVDSALYLRTVAPVLINVIEKVAAAGRASNNKNLVGTAQHLSMYLFGTYTPGKELLAQFKPTEKPVDPQVEKLQNQLKEVHEGQFNAFREDTINYMIHELRRTAGIGLDPENKKYTPFQREALLDKIIAEVGGQLSKNNLHQREMETLWNHAKQSGLTDEIRDRIIKTYLGRAKSILHAVKARNFGIKKPVSKVAINRGVPGPGRDKPMNPKQIDWRKTSDADFLNDKVTLRNR